MPGIELQIARDVLSQRERGVDDFHSCEAVRYTYRSPGRIAAPSVSELASAAIRSVDRAPARTDGISHLQDLSGNDIITPLTWEYRDEFLRRTRATLDEARSIAASELHLR